MHGSAHDTSAYIEFPFEPPGQEDESTGGAAPGTLLAGSYISSVWRSLSAAANIVQLEDGSTVTLDTMQIAIDVDAYVTTAIKICGQRQMAGNSQDLCMTREYSDFRTVPGTALYEPYREVFRIEGMYSDAELAEMAEAEEKLAEYEQQLAGMSDAERAMMERMVGPQIAQYRNMMSGGSTSFEIITTEIIVNPEPPDPDNTPFAVAEQFDEEQLIRRIQQDLETLRLRAWGLERRAYAPDRQSHRSVRGAPAHADHR